MPSVLDSKNKGNVALLDLAKEKLMRHGMQYDEYAIQVRQNGISLTAAAIRA